MVNLFGVPGSGKCFGKNTEVLMYDGTVKYIQDIKIGDIVMGDDSTPRLVLNLHRGVSKLYELRINKSENLIVSENHILCIARQQRNDRKKIRKWVNENISIEKYIAKSKCYKEKAKLYQVPVNYQERILGIEPYYLGLWLGDGLSESLNRFCTADSEIVDWCNNYANSLNIQLKQHSNKEEQCQIYCFSEGNTGNHLNHPIVKYDKIYHLQNNKHIPIEYMTSSEKQRLELLAGLIDSDGYLGNNYIEITQKNMVLADDIMRLCCSLGMNAQKKYVYKKSQNMSDLEEGNRYCKISISGDLRRIPTKLSRKIVKDQNQICNPLHHGFTIGDYGIGEYFGIETDGNQKFLLKNCMVVHNSTGSAYIFSKLKMQGINAELVTEFAKDKVWENNTEVFKNQAYLFGKQSYRMSRCKDKVDVIVTDSPLPLSIFYNNNPSLTENFNNSIMDVFNSYNNVNYLLLRTKPYNPAGRHQSEDESNALKQPMISMLEKYNISYVEVNGEIEGYDWIINDLLNKINTMEE